MGINNPLVSVLMTAYNREKFIAEAIESVLASSYKNFELIIVDDCSTDATVKIARSYVQKDVRIKCYVNKTNLGDYPNRNQAAAYANGEYIMYIDSDDKTYPDSISYCVMEMIASADAGMGILCRDVELCGKTLTPSQSVIQHFFKKAFLIMGPGGTILRKSFFEAIGKYPVKYGPANDMYFNLKVAATGNIKCLCKEFLYYRIHEGQELNNKDAYLIYNYSYLKDALNDLPLPLNNRQKKWIDKKSKRRFVVNVVAFLIKEKSIKKTIDTVRRANFNLGDAVKGVFH